MALSGAGIAVGVAVNRPQSMTYVVRLVSESPPEEQRRKQFLETGIATETVYMAMMDRYQLVTQWYRELEKEMQFKWNRPPQEFQSADY